jgi:hypothetical protein
MILKRGAVIAIGAADKSRPDWKSFPLLPVCDRVALQAVNNVQEIQR